MVHGGTAGFNPAEVAEHYCNDIYFFDYKARTLKQTIKLGPSGLIPLEVCAPGPCVVVVVVVVVVCGGVCGGGAGDAGEAGGADLAVVCYASLTQDALPIAVQIAVRACPPGGPRGGPAAGRSQGQKWHRVAGHTAMPGMHAELHSRQLP